MIQSLYVFILVIIAYVKLISDHYDEAKVFLDDDAKKSLFSISFFFMLLTVLCGMNWCICSRQIQGNFVIIFGKIESYVRMLEDQLNDAENEKYEKHLGVYVPKSLNEYKCYLSMYYRWEKENNPKPPSQVA